MQFYSSINNVYDYIFPLNVQQVNFVVEEIKEQAELLDIGCATGSLSIELAKLGFTMNASDLNSEMIEQAKQKSYAPKVNFSVGNMLNVNSDYEAMQFDGVLCFGNTLVHLTNKASIEKFIGAVYAVLKKGGKFMLQVLNYDYILSQQIDQLPVIENEKIKFIRKYEFLDNGLLSFNTQLTIKENEQQIDNRIELNPITKTEIIEVLTNIGFSSINVFGSFAKNEFTKSSLPLVISALK